MKRVVTIGALLGFLIGMGFGLAERAPWPDAIWRAALTAFIASLLMKWWGRVWVRSLQQAHQEKTSTDGEKTNEPESI